MKDLEADEIAFRKLVKALKNCSDEVQEEVKEELDEVLNT